MGLTFSASLNANGNPQIYGNNTNPQDAYNAPIIDNPFCHRIVVSKYATNIEVIITPVASKTIDITATLALTGNINLKNLMEATSTFELDVTSEGIVVTSVTVPTNNAGAVAPDYRLIFTDTTYEDHEFGIVVDKAALSPEQTEGTNDISFDYSFTPSLDDTYNPLSNFGIPDTGTVEYLYKLSSESTFTSLGSTTEFGVDPNYFEINYTFPDAFQGMSFRMIRSVYDVNNDLLYQFIDDVVDFNMTDEAPELTVSLSDLYCGCPSIDIIDGTTYQNRQNWWLGVFTRNIVDATPYYKGAEIGNYKNPVRDSSWAISIPFNGSYTFKAILVREYDEVSDYSAEDWVFNPIDNELYVSIQDDNIGNSLGNLVYWRKWNKITDLETVFSKTSNTVSETFLYQVLSKSISCNDSAPVNIRTKKSCLSSCSTLVIDDTTGEFDFEANPHGYGAPHYYRYEYANLYFLYNKRSDGAVVYKPATYNYLSAESILFDLKKDGIYKLRMFQVAIYDTDPTKRYYLNDSVYDETTNLFYASKVNNNTYPLTNTDAWKAVSKIEEFELLNNFGDWEWYYPITCNGYKTLNDIGLGLTNDICDASCKDVLFKKYDLVDVYLRGARNAFDVYDYDTAQCLLEAVPKNCAPYMGGKGGCGC